MCEQLNIVKIIIYVFMALLLLFGIIRSVKTNKLSHFILTIIIDIILFVGLLFFKNNYCKTETIVNKEVPTETTTTNKIVDDRIRTSKGYVIEEKDGVTYVDGILIVNKTYSLPKDYIPTDTYDQVGEQKYCQTCLNKEAYEAYVEMKSDAQALGLNLYIASGYRSYLAQEGLYNSYVSKDGKEAADTYSARAGHSEHQTGLAFDLNTVTDDFAYTDEGKWVAEMCYKYGFVIRYPKGKEEITGYKYEPWHLRYLGKDLAEKLYNNGNLITLEEYFGINSQYND